MKVRVMKAESWPGFLAPHFFYVFILAEYDVSQTERVSPIHQCCQSSMLSEFNLAVAKVRNRQSNSCRIQSYRTV